MIQGIVDATARTNAASRAFDLVLGHYPSVGIHSIWTEQIHSASRELSAARAECINAHKRFKEFAEFGIVPIDVGADPMRYKPSSGTNRDTNCLLLD
jgi:hypothetical protein